MDEDRIDGMLREIESHWHEERQRISPPASERWAPPMELFARARLARERRKQLAYQLRVALIIGCGGALVITLLAWWTGLIW